MNEDAPNEERWIARERERVVEYLVGQNVEHLGVGEYPAFHVCPCLALWAVQSKKAPGSIGWWVISGDVPIDYISSGDCRHPRKALRAFSKYWGEVSDCMLRGEPHPTVTIGKPEQWPELGDMLRSRAELIQKWSEDDQLWSPDDLR